MEFLAVLLAILYLVLLMIKMVIYLKAIGPTIKKMERGKLPIPMEIYMRVTGVKIIYKESEFILILTAINMMVNG